MIKIIDINFSNILNNASKIIGFHTYLNTQFEKDLNAIFDTYLKNEVDPKLLFNVFGEILELFDKFKLKFD